MAAPGRKPPLWTTTGVARALGVGVSSIKRWTDEGELKSVKTVGGHRRYHLDDIHDFASRHGLHITGLPTLPVGSLPELPRDPQSIAARLRDAAGAGRSDEARTLLAHGFHDASNGARFLDEVAGSVMTEIGDLWERGSWGVEEEHRASYVIAESVDALRPFRGGVGPVAILACPPDELHDFPLRMVRVILESSGWRTDYLGANVPWTAIWAALDRQKPRMLLLTSRQAGAFGSADFLELAAHWTRLGVTVGVGGSWARGGARRDRDWVRFRTLRGFERWLRGVGH